MFPSDRYRLSLTFVSVACPPFQIRKPLSEISELAYCGVAFYGRQSSVTFGDVLLELGHLILEHCGIHLGALGGEF